MASPGSRYSPADELDKRRHQAVDLVKAAPASRRFVDLGFPLILQFRLDVDHHHRSHPPHAMMPSPDCPTRGVRPMSRGEQSALFTFFT